VELLDPFSEAEPSEAVRDSLAKAFGTGQQPTVLVVRNLGTITSAKLGLLVRAISQAFGPCPDRVALVSSDDSFASLFEVPSEPLFRHFGTTEEAIDYLFRRFTSSEVEE